ncbi:hypothetical protein GCM10010498_65310 [Streptomyces cavourensis]|nr:hypothetical protein GCM10010498_65310 [Streptomyces cavourensis]
MIRNAPRATGNPLGWMKETWGTFRWHTASGIFLRKAPAKITGEFRPTAPPKETQAGAVNGRTNRQENRVPKSGCRLA